MAGNSPGRRQPKQWRPEGRWGRVAMNMWDAVLALVALGAFVVVAVLLLQSDTDGRLPWILWGIGLGAALFWAGSKVNDMLVRETSVKRVAEFGSTAAAEAEIQRKAS